MFAPRAARRSLERYRRKGLDRLERMMLRSAAAGRLEGRRVLEIGGGIGILQSELLDAIMTTLGALHPDEEHRAASSSSSPPTSRMPASSLETEASRTGLRFVWPMCSTRPTWPIQPR